MDAKRKRAIAKDFRGFDGGVRRARARTIDSLVLEVSKKLDDLTEQIEMHQSEDRFHAMCTQLGQSSALTEAMLDVIRAIDQLSRDEQQRVLLAVGDLLALDRPGNEP